ncbi:SHQ1, H/ACA ribonucleoprotein assembly factor [Phyllostomus discolor]|nr:SHQ1, H/ACA ribonucleoprotein assembly factor [Phyllostomus discolor]
MEAAHCVSVPQTSSSSSEASDVEDSDSTTSSESEDSASEQEELKNSESETVNSLQGPFLEESSALLIDDGAVCRNSAILKSDVRQGKPLISSQALGGFGPLVEELGEQLKTTVQISRPKGSVAENLCCVQDKDDWQSEKKLSWGKNRKTRR